MTAKVYRRNNPQPGQGLWLLMHDDGLFAEISSDGIIRDGGTWIGPSVQKLIETNIIDAGDHPISRRAWDAMNHYENPANIMAWVDAHKQKQVVTEPTSTMTEDRFSKIKQALQLVSDLRQIVEHTKTRDYACDVSLSRMAEDLGHMHYHKIQPLPIEIVNQITATVRAYYEEELRKAEEEFARS